MGIGTMTDVFPIIHGHMQTSARNGDVAIASRIPNFGRRATTGGALFR